MMHRIQSAAFAILVLGMFGCDGPAPSTESASGSPTPGVPDGASPSQNQSAGQPDPAKPVAEAAVRESAEAVDLYELDLDEDTGLHYWDESRQELYSGPIFANYDSGMIELLGQLREGIEDGWWIEYYEDGVKLSQGNYQGGVEEGFWIYWWENGNVESYGMFEGGSPVGKWVTFFEDGARDAEGLYSEGLMDGDWIFYDQETGEKTTIRFEKGTKVSP